MWIKSTAVNEQGGVVLVVKLRAKGAENGVEKRGGSEACL